jgi:hypothetical protein
VSTIKYQIFISSTYTDLKDERDEVIKAILEMGHIPVGMEMFSAADEEQWKLISRQIDQSDYYIVIVAHRYGSVVGKKSYTEKEYDYAIQKSVPVIGFIINDSALWPKDKIESDTNKAESLKRFKQKIKRKPVGFWSIKDELCGKVSRSLIKLITTNPRPGWIRTSETVGPEVVSEMSRLSSENARLVNENIQLRQQLEGALKTENANFSQGKENVEIEYNYTNVNSQEKNDGKFCTNWDNLFIEIAKSLLQNTAEFSIVEILRRMVVLSMPNKPNWASIKPTSVLTIKTQFIALGYIDVQVITIPNNNNSGSRLGSQHPHWNLTLLGKRKLAELLAIRRMDQA